MKTDKLKGHIPDSVLGQLPDVIAKFELNTPLRLAHFLAQTATPPVFSSRISPMQSEQPTTSPFKLRPDPIQ